MMAGLNLLLVALFCLWATEGLLLQKRRPSLLPDKSTKDLNRAADSFRFQLLKHLKEESSKPRTTTPRPARTHPNTTPNIPLGLDGKTGSLDVYPSHYIEGKVKRTSESDPDLQEIMPLALNMLSDSTGVMVTQKREKRSSVPTSAIRIFETGGRTLRTCNPNDSTRVVIVAGCGDHYLFPGYNVILVQDDKDCSWRFRHSAPEVLVTLNGVKRIHGMQIYIEKADVSTSLVKKGRYAYSRNRTRLFEDLVLSLPADARAEGISVDVCVPPSPENEKYAEYEARMPKFLYRPSSSNCGHPTGYLNDTNFNIDSIPWEMVFTVTVKSTENSDVFLLSYCSGSLISSEWALTTASCILTPERENPGSTPFVTAAFGDSADPSVRRYGIKEFIIYPAATEDHDIALVRLAEKVEQRTPVCLPEYKKPDINAGVTNTVGTVIGWVLDGADIPYISNRPVYVTNSDDCSFTLRRKLPPHILCTEDHTIGTTPCIADGDLLMGADKLTLRGLSNPRLDCKDVRRTHTSVAHFMPWIANVTGLFTGS